MLLPLLAGLALGLSYLPAPLIALNLTAFVPLLAWFDGRPEASAWQRLRGGFVFGFVAYLIGLHFMYAMLRFSWLAALLYVALAAAMAARAAAVVTLGAWLRRRLGLSWTIVLPLVWIPMEWLSTFGDLRLTADHLSHAVARNPFLVQFADLLGPYGVDLVVLVTNGLLLDLFSRSGRPRRRAVVALVVLWVAVLGYDVFRWRGDEPAETLRVGVVQPNIDFGVKGDPQTAAELSRRLAELSGRAADDGARLIVWPESTRPFAVQHWLARPASYAMPELQTLARQLDAAFLVGAEYAQIRGRADYDYYNAALVVHSDGRIADEWAAKHYLVPFTEAVPFRSLFGPLVEGKRDGAWRWVAGGFDAGPDPRPIDVDGVPVGVLVCYEQLFAELPRRLRNRGAELQVVVTNDVWWGRSFFQRYQANALRLRAIENRTAFVRAANTGISGFVDTRGRYREMTSLYEEAVVVADVALTRARTLYDRVGDLVAISLTTLLAASVVLARRR